MTESRQYKYRRAMKLTLPESTAPRCAGSSSSLLPRQNSKPRRPGYRTTRKERKQSSKGDCQRHRKCNNGSRDKISHGRPPSKFRSSFSSTRIVKRTSPSPTPPSLEIPIAPQSHPSIHPRPKKNISPKKNRSKPGVVVTSREDPSRSHSPIPTPPNPPIQPNHHTLHALPPLRDLASRILLLWLL